jgi:hypothetical protein
VTLYYAKQFKALGDRLARERITPRRFSTPCAAPLCVSMQGLAGATQAGHYRALHRARSGEPSRW